MSISDENRCHDCGMYVQPGDYHPYAACVMYRQCRQGEKVESWLAQIIQHGRDLERADRSPAVSPDKGQD
jgi:hypothetical protein